MQKIAILATCEMVPGVGNVWILSWQRLKNLLSDFLWPHLQEVKYDGANLYPGITNFWRSASFKNLDFEPAQNRQTLKNGGKFNTQN